MSARLWVNIFGVRVDFRKVLRFLTVRFDHGSRCTACAPYSPTQTWRRRHPPKGHLEIQPFTAVWTRGAPRNDQRLVGRVTKDAALFDFVGGDHQARSPNTSCSVGAYCTLPGFLLDASAYLSDPARRRGSFAVGRGKSPAPPVEPGKHFLSPTVRCCSWVVCIPYTILRINCT